MNITSEEIAEIRRIQATLTNIKLGNKCFFNIVLFRDKYGLVVERNGKWHLTAKGAQMMNFAI